MTLQDLFSTLKGNTHSGNYGHAVRPGKEGGSSIGGGHVKIGVDTRDQIPKKVGDYKKSRPTKEAPEKPVSTFDKVSKEQEAQLIAHYNLKDFAGKNKAEGKAIANYTCWTCPGNFNQVNGPLRKDKKLSKAAEKATANLDAAFEKAPRTPLDMQVHWATRFNKIKNKEMIDKLTSLKPGDSFTDKGFVSTSLSPGIVKNEFFSGSPSHTQVNFKIDVPAGSKAIYAKDLSYTKRERELILPRGQEFIVKSTVTKKDGTVEITLGLKE